MLNCARISKDEEFALLQHTQQVHEAIDKLVERLPPELWTRRRTSDEWSPEEIVEHALLVEDGILAGVAQHLHDEPSDRWQQQTAGKEVLLRTFLPSFGKTEASVRTSTFLGLSQYEVQAALAERFRSLSDLLREWSEIPLKALVWEHGKFGSLSAYHRLIYIPLHSERHLNQLLRVTSRLLGKNV